MTGKLLPRANQIFNSAARRDDKCNSHVCMLLSVNTYMCIHEKPPNLFIQSIKSKSWHV